MSKKKPESLDREPSKKKRPRVKSIRTTSTGDPDVDRIYFNFTLPDNESLTEATLEAIKCIQISLVDTEDQGTPALALYEMTYVIPPEVNGVSATSFYCEVQPSPHEGTNTFFGHAHNKNINVNIIYNIEDDGLNFEVMDSWENIECSPTGYN